MFQTILLLAQSFPNKWWFLTCFSSFPLNLFIHELEISAKDLRGRKTELNFFLVFVVSDSNRDKGPVILKRNLPSQPLCLPVLHSLLELAFSFPNWLWDLVNSISKSRTNQPLLVDILVVLYTLHILQEAMPKMADERETGVGRRRSWKLERGWWNSGTQGRRRSWERREKKREKEGKKGGVGDRESSRFPLFLFPCAQNPSSRWIIQLWFRLGLTTFCIARLSILFTWSLTLPYCQPSSVCQSVCVHAWVWYSWFWNVHETGAPLSSWQICEIQRHHHHQHLPHFLERQVVPKLHCIDFSFPWHNDNVVDRSIFFLRTVLWRLTSSLKSPQTSLLPCTYLLTYLPSVAPPRTQTWKRSSSWEIMSDDSCAHSRELSAVPRKSMKLPRDWTTTFTEALSSFIRTDTTPIEAQYLPWSRYSSHTRRMIGACLISSSLWPQV